MCQEASATNSAPRDLRGCHLCGIDPGLKTLRRLLRLEHGSGGGEEIGEGQLVGSDLPEALRAFRKQGEAAAAGTKGGAALVDAACQLVEAVLLGLHRHLPHVSAKAVLREGDPVNGDVEDAVASLRVHFDPGPLIGEISTRTRIAVSVYVAKDVRFTLRRLPKDAQDGPLALCVDGLAMPRLPDVVRLRELLREELGQNLTAEACFAWWQQHKDTLFPLKTSKFHRLVESLIGMRSFQMMPAALHSDTFWGYMNTSDLDIEAFEFHRDKANGITVTARQRPPQSPEDEQARVQNALIARKMLVENRKTGGRLCPSAVNVAAMLYGPDVDQPGAQLNIIVKLLSAAQWWGRGTDGWNQWDETWLCTDKKDRFGRCVEEQGRVIWRVAGHKQAPSVRSRDTESKERTVLLGLSPLGFASLCILVLMLWLMRGLFLVAP